MIRDKTCVCVWVGERERVLRRVKERLDKMGNKRPKEERRAGGGGGEKEGERLRIWGSRVEGVTSGVKAMR